MVSSSIKSHSPNLVAESPHKPVFNAFYGNKTPRMHHPGRLQRVFEISLRWWIPIPGLVLLFPF
jgi:hypothetical protein